MIIFMDSRISNKHPVVTSSLFTAQLNHYVPQIDGSFIRRFHATTCNLHLDNMVEETINDIQMYGSVNWVFRRYHFLHTNDILTTHIMFQLIWLLL